MKFIEKLKKRDVSYELIRVIAMSLIVFDHNAKFYLGGKTSTFLEPILVVGVTLFFMLSGKFAFKLNLEDKSLYKKYYWKKVLGLIIPILVFMAIKNWHIMYYNQHLAITPISYLRHFGVALVNGFNYMEYWFLYTLIALLIAVPFTAHMMQNMKDNDRKAFLIVSTVLATLSVLIPSVLKVDFAVNYYFMGHIFFFYIGYIIEDIFKTKSSRIKLYTLGIIGLIATILMTKYGFMKGYKSYSPFYMYFTLATFIGLRELGKKIPKKLESLVLFFGKHSLSVYMLHMIILYTLRDFNIFPINPLGYFGCTISAIVISLIIGATIDETVVKSLQRITAKVFRLDKFLNQK